MPHDEWFFSNMPFAAPIATSKRALALIVIGFLLASSAICSSVLLPTCCRHFLFLSSGLFFRRFCLSLAVFLHSLSQLCGHTFLDAFVPCFCCFSQLFLLAAFLLPEACIFHPGTLSAASFRALLFVTALSSILLLIVFAVLLWCTTVLATLYHL